MKHFAVALILLPILLSVGCSNKLSRREAEHQIDAMLKPHLLGNSKRMAGGGVPGFNPPSDDLQPSSYFTLDEHKEYGGLSSQMSKSPDNEEYTLDALSKLGYISVSEEGPKSVVSNGFTFKYPHSRTVAFTQKVGTITDTDYSKSYSSGFSCYPKPAFSQCDLPSLIDTAQSYKITGIVQDDTHAKVNILIPWKLTQFAMELKPYAASIEANENKLGIDSDYSRYAALYPWEHFLNSHAPAGTSPATILFQKFDDGWRIVDENGKSEKDYN